MTKHKLLSLILILFLILPCMPLQAAENYFYDGTWNLYTSETVTVILDDEQVNFDVPPLIIGDRTLVPVRAVFEKAGATVSWDQNKQQVTIKKDNYTVQLVIDSKVGVVNGEAAIMDVPAKIVTDTTGTARTLIPLRFISESLGYSVLWNGEDYTASVYTDEYSGEIPNDNKEKNSIYEIKNYVLGENDIIEIYTDNLSSNPDVSLMTNPNRLVLDFSELTLSVKDGATDTAGRLISNVRYAYHQDKYTRVVLDLKGQPEYEFSKEKNCYKVVLSGSAYKNITYNNLGNYYIEFEKGTLSEVSTNDAEFIYVFMSTSQDLGEGIINANDTYIDTVTVEPTTNGTKITVKAKCTLEFNIKNNSDSAVLEYSRTHIDESNNTELSNEAKEMLVVIDAGHGGSDPGAVGKEGNIVDLQEKDVTLDVSLMLYDILKNSGVKVMMTRETDVYVGLEERARIANENNAALFVSVHINSFTSPDPTGSMVYYYANSTSDTKNTESIAMGKVLAQNILTEIVSELGTVDRGLGDGSRFVVIKRTTMPAVIVEGAFISNPSDKALMKTKEFRQNMAEGIASGIIDTLNQMVK